MFRIFLFDRFTLSVDVEGYKSRYKVHTDSQEYTKRCMLTIVYVAARYFAFDAPVLVNNGIILRCGILRIQRLTCRRATACVSLRGSLRGSTKCFPKYEIRESSPRYCTSLTCSGRWNSVINPRHYRSFTMLEALFVLLEKERKANESQSYVCIRKYIFFNKLIKKAKYLNK